MTFRGEMVCLSFRWKRCLRQRKGPCCLGWPVGRRSRSEQRIELCSGLGFAPPAVPRPPVTTAIRQERSLLAVPCWRACASVVLVSVCLSAFLNEEPSWCRGQFRQLPVWGFDLVRPAGWRAHAHEEEGGVGTGKMGRNLMSYVPVTCGQCLRQYHSRGQPSPATRV